MQIQYNNNSFFYQQYNKLVISNLQGNYTNTSLMNKKNSKKHPLSTYNSHQNIGYLRNRQISKIMDHRVVDDNTYYQVVYDDGTEQQIPQQSLCARPNSMARLQNYIRAIKYLDSASQNNINSSFYSRSHQGQQNYKKKNEETKYCYQAQQDMQEQQSSSLNVNEHNMHQNTEYRQQSNMQTNPGGKPSPFIYNNNSFSYPDTGKCLSQERIQKMGAYIEQSEYNKIGQNRIKNNRCEQNKSQWRSIVTQKHKLLEPKTSKNLQQKFKIIKMDGNQKTGVTRFLLKFIDSSVCWFSATQVKKAVPNQVIRFYEKNMHTLDVHIIN